MTPTDDRDAPPGYRRVWALAWPIMLSNLSIPLVGAVDTAVMGRMPDPAYIGAVAVGASLFSLLFWTFGFLRMGTTGFVAQGFGARDGTAIRIAVARALLLALVLAVLMLLLQWPVAVIAFTVIEASATVEALARTYFDIRIWSAPATFANYALLGALIGLQRTRAVLLHQLVLNGTNVGLDLLFVPGLGMGVDGVAWASVIAEFTAVGLGLWLIVRALRPLPGRNTRRALLAPEGLRALLAVNGNILIRTLCLVGSFFWFTASGGRIGEIELAANAVLLQFFFFLAYGLDGFAHAAEGLAGAAWGRRSRRHFTAAVRTTTVSACAVALLFTATYAALGPLFITWLTDLETVRTTAADYLPWMIVAPLIAVWSFQLDGIFIGTTRTVEMRNAMLASTALFLAATALLIPALSNHGLWLALMLFLAVRALSLLYYMPRLHRGIGDSTPAPDSR